MARPTDWTPLGLASDPVPGDPARIGQEAAHLAAVARQITDQVAALHTIAAGGASGALKGQYADKIHSAASSLAGQLDKVVGRYREVSSALNQWIPDLEQAQAQSVTALNQAEVPHKKLTTPALLPSGSNLTAQQKQAVQDYHTSMNQAQGELDAAKALLTKATTFRDERASHYASVINKATDDGMKDSWWDSVEGALTSAWDSVKDWVTRNAWWLKDLATALEVIGTILAIAALIFTGVGLLVLLAVAVTAGALLIRTLLAATGNGSWLDVALDTAALLTFGFGRIAATAMKGTVTAARATAEGLIAAERAASPLGRAAAVLGRGADFMKSGPVAKALGTALDKAGLGNFVELADQGLAKIGSVAGKVSVAGLEKASPSIEKTLATVSEHVKPFETVMYGGEKENLILSRTFKAIVGRFPSSLELTALNEQFGSQMHLAQSFFGAGIAADWSSKIVGGLKIEPGKIGPIQIPEINLHLPSNPISHFYDDVGKWTTTSGGLGG
jgi:hypothetical protein